MDTVKVFSCNKMFDKTQLQYNTSVSVIKNVSLYR